MRQWIQNPRCWDNRGFFACPKEETCHPCPWDFGAVLCLAVGSPLSPTYHVTHIPRCCTCVGIPRNAARSAIGTVNDAGTRWEADPGDGCFSAPNPAEARVRNSSRRVRKNQLRDVVEPVQVVDVVIGVRIRGLDQVDQHPPRQAERFTDEREVLSDLSDSISLARKSSIWSWMESPSTMTDLPVSCPSRPARLLVGRALGIPECPGCNCSPESGSAALLWSSTSRSAHTRRPPPTSRQAFHGGGQPCPTGVFAVNGGRLRGDRGGRVPEPARTTWGDRRTSRPARTRLSIKRSGRDRFGDPNSCTRDR